MQLLEKVNNKSAVVGIIGLGYVGLPLGLEFALKGFKVIGFDLDPRKPEFLSQKKSYIKHISEVKIAKAVDSGKFSATTDFSRLPEADAIIICVPTPLDEHREPDMTYIVNSSKMIQQYLRKGQFVSLESTTYPGTTDEILLPMFEEAPIVQGKTDAKKLVVGEDFYLAFSPEREDPNNPDYSTATIPKVVGGTTPKCLEIAKALYGNVIVKVVPVSSTAAAEATKILENVYRAINIALVNELKMVFDRMGIDVWEVIEAAKTKPFGFNAFYPGPGLGGHCIPIDPFYLTWKAREYDINTKFIELAGEVNTYQPYYVVERTREALDCKRKPLNGAKVLILGAAYKKDIDDMRESPSLKLIEIFREKGAEVSYNDPYVPKLPKTRKYEFQMDSVELTAENLGSFDAVVLSTDHTNYDYKFIAENAKIVVDSRNAFAKNGVKKENIYKA
ncbi:MAG: nucleotide sugar dehydrogenase [Ignavibacteria bacterium]|jgi:UDP-N-acetyl-D-glucosamine dehydrogenase|nr:nucleotide sugar dehydrogenase [Ignavibacteria bacterium]